ncbi:type VI secretion system tip protein VgrG [Paraburkholderia sp. T12-10]|nr:type VI secretion system tip protein VgrG [Paraburkholderia sp. T12-10]
MSKAPDFFKLLNAPRHIDAQTPLSGRSKLLLVAFDCTEGLSLIDEMQASFVSQDPTIELKRMIGQPVTVFLQQDNALSSSQQRYFHGYITAFSHVNNDGGLARYEAEIRPWLWRLTRRQDIRIFQEQSVEAILSRVFHEFGSLASFEFRLSKATANRSYCTQYRETDLAFVLRLMQEEGLFFYFEHTKGSHKLIITDTSTSAKPIDGFSPQIPYSQDERLDNIDVISSFQSFRQMSSGSVSLKTADYKVPHALREAGLDIENDQGDVPSYDIYDYPGAHAYPDEDRGQELAGFRAEAIAATAKLFFGETTSRKLMPRRYFQLENHYDHEDAEPEDRQFMLIKIRHSARNNYQTGDGAATYSATFTCIRKKIPYRPAQTIARPVISGVQTAFVTGPAGQEIYTDELGRVKVHFHWDRLGKQDHTSSCWLRTIHPWAGRGYGMLHIPRIGDEVAVIFVDGSPDRPIIMGSVPNAINSVQWKLPDNQALSGLRSRELASAQENRVVADDTNGKLQVQVWSDHAQSRLVVGYNTRITGHAGRGQARGTGWELATDAWGVLRANKGMLVTTEARAGAAAAVKDMGETVQRLAQAREQHDTLASAAVKAQAQDGQDQPAVTDALKRQNDEIGGQAGGDFPELSKPHLVLASPAGIQATTAGSAHLASGEHTAITTGGHLSVSTGSSLLASAKNAIRFFAYKLGIRMVSYAGDIDIKALQKNLNLLAKLDITQTAESITIRATKQLMLNGGDSYISLNRGQITVGSGKFEVNAQVSTMPSKTMGVNAIGQPDVQLHDQTFRILSPTGTPLPGVDYRVSAPSGGHVFRTGDQGRSPTLNTAQQEAAQFELHWDEFAAHSTRSGA